MPPLGVLPTCGRGLELSVPERCWRRRTRATALSPPLAPRAASAGAGGEGTRKFALAHLRSIWKLAEKYLAIHSIH